MTINDYVKRWCDEDYDVRKEDFYVENAYYVAEREWAVSGFKHGLFALVVAAATILTADGSVAESILDAFVNIGIMAVCFFLFGIRDYGANDVGTSLGIYIMTAILLFATKPRVSDLIQIAFAIPAFAVYVYLSFVRPAKFLKMHKKMKQRIIQEEQEEEEADRAAHESWERSYKAYRYGLPEAEAAEKGDPMMKEARALFENYSENKQMLKSRYRQLMKEHHPDRGGNERLCQCIIAVYEELNQKVC